MPHKRKEGSVGGHGNAWHKANPELTKRIRERWLNRHPHYARNARRRRLETIPGRADKEWLDNKIRELRKCYALSKDSFDKMLEEQNGCCLLCKKPFSFERRQGNPHWPCVDHDHKTGKIRALIHNICNRAIGAFGDNPEMCKLGALYLESFK